MGPTPAAELAAALARQAEAVCRHYLSSGHRVGRYWIVGDVRNAPGRSMFVRLTGPDFGRGAAGRWTDAASGEHGDLLDVIRCCCGLIAFSDVAGEARRFLSQPIPQPRPAPGPPAPRGGREAARRLWAITVPLAGTVAETYLRSRGIAPLHHAGALRFHPRCYYRPDTHGPTQTWPAMIAAVTDLSGAITGVHRTWLGLDGAGKAPIGTPRRAMGALAGNAVRFGTVSEVMAAGEGIETVLALRTALPAMPMVAALSAHHLAAIAFPPVLRRLYIARDDDAAGDMAAAMLTRRAETAGIKVLVLSPRYGDFNEDLRRLGLDTLRANVSAQLAPRDVARSVLRP